MTDLFDLAQRRLEYLDQRQRVLSQNVANADTPGYRARDLVPFTAFLARTAVEPLRTSPLHLASAVGPGPRPVNERLVARAPDGNAVDLPVQLTRIADGETSQALVANLWKTTMSMYLTALGKN